MSTNKTFNKVQLDVKFTQAATRANLISEENISISFGKISKYFADLHSQAFTGYTHPTYTARTGKPTGNQTPGFGSTFTISQITSDGTGHVTGATDRTVKIPDTTMGAASADTAGSKGLVPAPAAGKQTSFLRGDGTWVVPTNTTYSAGAHLSLSSTTFSLASYCKSITDWNSATTNGWYMGSSVTNAPSTEWWMGRVIAHNNKYCIQEVWNFSVSAPDNANPDAMYMSHKKRWFRAEHWGPWVDVSTPTPSAKVDCDWDNVASRTTNVTRGWMALWNGAYNGTSSNLTYCNRGAFGTIVTKNTGDYVPNTQAGVNAAINLLSTGSSTPSLADYYVSQYANGGTTTTSYHRRPISALWDAFKGLITLTTTGSGNAVTAVSIANDGDNNRKITVTKGSTFSLSTHTHSNYLPMSTVSSSTDADTLFTTSQWINWNTTTEVETTHMPTTNYGILLAKAYPGIQVFIPDSAAGIYFRKKTNANTAATAWWGITGTAGNTYNLNNFLPLSGGTMTGDIVYPHSDGRSSTMTNSGMTYKIAQSNNWAMGLTYVNSGGTHVGFIGAYGTTDAFESIRFGAKYNDWWMEITDTKTTITGDLVFSTVTSTTYPAKSKMISFGGSTDWGRIYYRVDASDAGRLVLDIGDDSNARIDFAYNGTTKSHIDTSGNFSGNAYSATNVNITVTNGSTTSTDYGIVFAVNPNTTELNILRKTNDFRYQMKDGAANTEGFATIVLGNTKKLSEANNKSGNIYLYSSGGNWHLINTTSTTSNITHTLPATSGTILNSGTTSFTQTLSSGTKIGTIKINGTSTDLYCQTNTNTTYTIATGDSNGQIKVTPSSGSAYNVPVKGLDSAAYTASTSYVQTHSGANFNVAKSGYFAVMANENSDNPNSLLPTQNQWWHILSMSWNSYDSTDNSDVTHWVSQLAIPTYQNKLIGMKWRTNSSGGSALTRDDWATVLDERNSPAFKAITQRQLRVTGGVGWYRILTLSCSTNNGQLMNDIKIFVRRQYNNGTPESFSAHIVNNYSATPPIYITHAIQASKYFTQIRVSKASDGKYQYVEIYYNSSNQNAFVIQYNYIAPYSLATSTYGSPVYPTDNTDVSPITDSPTAMTTVNIPTNVMQANYKSDGTYWGLVSPKGEEGVWIRTTTNGLLPVQSGNAGSGHSSLGTSEWYFAHAYIDTVHALKYHGWYGQKTNDTRQSTANLTCAGKGAMQLILVSSTLTTGRPVADGYIMDFDWDNTGQYKAQLYIPNTSTNNCMQWRAQSGSSDWSAAACAWRNVLDNSNYTSYTVTKTGGGASGSWGINITGSATSANKLNTNAGATNRPVYFSGGVPVQCDAPGSGSYFKGVPLIGTDGVMEIGKYIDFHNTNGSTADYDYRMEITTTTMTLHATGSSNILTIKSPDYTQLCFQTTSSGKAYTASGIICYPLTTSGMTSLFSFGGNVVIGGGEAAKTLYDNNYDTIKTTENEDLYLCADHDIHIVTGCQTYADKSIIEIDTTGKVYLPTSGGIVVKQRSDSNYVSAVTWWKGGTAPGSGEYAPHIGQHNTGGDSSYPGSICILPYKSTTNPWGGTVGLFIRKDHVYIDGVELSKSTHTHSNYLGTKSNGTYYGMASPTGADNVWIRATSQGIIPSASAKFFQTATSSLGTNTWYFKNSYIQYMNANSLVLGAAKTADGAAKGQVKFFSGNGSDATGTVTLECTDDVVHTGDYTVKLPTWNGTIPIFEKLFEGASNTVSLSYSDIDEYDVFLITVANSNATSEQVTVTSLWISNVAGIHDMPLIWGGAPTSSGGSCNVTSGWIQLSKNSGTTTFVVAHKPNVAQMTSSGWTISSPTYNLYIRKIFGLKAYKRT